MCPGSTWPLCTSMCRQHPKHTYSKPYETTLLTYAQCVLCRKFNSHGMPRTAVLQHAAACRRCTRYM